VTVPTHFRMAVRGIFYNTPEQWQYGCHFERQLTGGSDTPLSAISVSAVRTALTTLHNSALFHQFCRVTEWRMYQIGTNGLMEGNGPLLDILPSTINGTGTSGFNYPPGISVVVSLLAANRGPAKYGRCYLPGPGKPLATDGRLAAADAASYGAAFSQFLDDVGHAIDAPGTTQQTFAVNVSDRPAGTGTKQKITHVETGRVLDNLDSRRNKMLEDRQVTADISWDLI